YWNSWVRRDAAQGPLRVIAQAVEKGVMTPGVCEQAEKGGDAKGNAFETSCWRLAVHGGLPSSPRKTGGDTRLISMQRKRPAIALAQPLNDTQTQAIPVRRRCP